MYQTPIKVEVHELYPFQVSFFKCYDDKAILKNILSKDSRLTDLNIAENNLSSVNVRLLGEAVTKMESVDIGDTILTTQQIEAILTEICKNTNLTNLNMSGNNLSSVEPGLLARAVSQIETIDIGDTSLTSRHMEDILRTALEEKSKLAKVDMWDRRMD